MMLGAIILCMVLLASCTGQPKQSEPAADSDDKPHYWVASKDLNREGRTGGHTSVAEDGKLAVVSGYYDGGNTPECWSEFKIIKSPGDTLSVDMGDGYYMYNIHAIKKRNGDTYYIVGNYGKSSGTQADECLTAYRIKNDTIRQVSVIDGGSDYKKSDKGHFYVMYSIPNWYHATNGFGYDWILEFEPKTGRLFVPLTDKNDYYTLNDRYHVWQFDGNRFVDKGCQPHKDLHRSLSEYVCLLQYFDTKDYIARVDSLADKTLRLALWKKPKTMANQPDKVIGNGCRNEYKSVSEGVKCGDGFRFNHNDYQYLVSYSETKFDKNGWGKNHDYLVVKKKGKVILKQEKITK